MLDGLGGTVHRSRPDYDSIDPTLDACCQREEESNRRRQALEITLARYDRISMAERRRRYVVSDFSFGSGCRCCYDPKADGGEYTALTEARMKLQEHNQQFLDDHEDEPDKKRGSESEKEDSDDEFDYLLEEDHDDADIHKMEEERKAELYLAALTFESATYHGFGTHRQIHPQHIVRAIGLDVNGTNTRVMNHSPSVVLHLYDDMSPLSASLDILLEKIAPRYKGTKFIRCDGKIAFRWNPNLGRDLRFPNGKDLICYLPCVIAIRKGQVVASSYNMLGLGDTKQGIVDPTAVENWLHYAGILDAQLQLSLEDFCRFRPEEEALHNNVIRETERMKEIECPNVYLCGVAGCRKTFVHEHIGIVNEEQKGLLVQEKLTLGGETNT